MEGKYNDTVSCLWTLSLLFCLYDSQMQTSMTVTVLHLTFIMELFSYILYFWLSMCLELLRLSFVNTFEILALKNTHYFCYPFSAPSIACNNKKTKTSKNLFFVQSAEWLWTFNLHNFYSVYDGPPLNCQVLLRLLQVLMTQLSASALLKSFNRLLDVWFYLRLTKIDK